MYAAANGIAADRLLSRGFGLGKPVGDNATDEGRQANRRVELVAMSDTEKANLQNLPKPSPKKTNGSKAK